MRFQSNYSFTNIFSDIKFELYATNDQLITETLNLSNC